MTLLAEIIFWAALFLLLYVYIGYFVILKSAACLINFPKSPQSHMTDFGDTFCPAVSVIIAAYNEEANIIDRITNIRAQRYDREKVQIIVASDGSDDNTNLLVKRQNDPRIILLDFKDRRGRSLVHNDAVAAASAEIVIFTDADTVFDPFFVAKIVTPFKKSSTGCVVGNLIYKTDQGDVAESEGRYWKFEKKVRELESRFGLLATGTGACMALRKKYWCRLGPIDDVDFILPLQVLRKGSKVIFTEDAVAYDYPSNNIRTEFKTRVRQTSRNLPGTLKKWSISQWIRHPMITWSLISHKLLRWHSFFLMSIVLLANVVLIKQGRLYGFLFWGQVLFYISAGIGYFCTTGRLQIPILSSIFTFVVATAGMAVGVLKAAVGTPPATYNKRKSD